jgi:hypothetical protein
LPCPLGLDTDLSLGDLRFLALPPLRLPKVTLLELLTAFATFLFSFSHDYFFTHEFIGFAFEVGDAAFLLDNEDFFEALKYCFP